MQRTLGQSRRAPVTVASREAVCGPGRIGRPPAAWPHPHLMRLSGLGPAVVQFQHGVEMKPKICGSGEGAPRGDNQ